MDQVVRHIVICKAGVRVHLQPPEPYTHGPHTGQIRQRLTGTHGRPGIRDQRIRIGESFPWDNNRSSKLGDRKTTGRHLTILTARF